jgi:hypothetical protein
MHLVCLHDLNMTFQYVSIKAVIGYIKIWLEKLLWTLLIQRISKEYWLILIIY